MIKDESDLEYRKKIETHIDNGYGSCILEVDDCANIIISSWKFFDNDRYRLLAYVVMPNHVHVLIQVMENQELSKIIHSWKSYTSNQLKKVLALLGNNDLFPENGVWQREYWDRFIRSEEHYHNTIAYIHYNPVKAGLVKHSKDWPWSSKRIK